MFKSIPIPKAKLKQNISPTITFKFRTMKSVHIIIFYPPWSKIYIKNLANLAVLRLSKMQYQKLFWEFRIIFNFKVFMHTLMVYLDIQKVFSLQASEGAIVDSEYIVQIRIS